MSRTWMHSGLISEKKDSSRIFLKTLSGENGTFTCMIRTATRSRLRDRCHTTHELSRSKPTHEGGRLGKAAPFCASSSKTGFSNTWFHPGIPETNDLVCNELW